MSAISGKGHGESHDWEYLDTVYRVSHYRCRACDERFAHDYPRIANIFTAMRLTEVVDVCPKSTTYLVELSKREGGEKL